MQTLFTIDAHAAGEPTRIVTAGFPPLRGRTVSEKREALRKEADWVRRCLTLEPRGHANMFGALLIREDGADNLYSLIFFDTGGYLNGCGHGTMCSAAVWTKLNGLPATPYRIGNPDGSTTIVERLEKRGENGCRVTLLMPTASVIGSEIAIDGADVNGSIAVCGNKYLLLEAASVGLSPLREAAPAEMRARAAELLEGNGARPGTRLPGDDYEILFYERQQASPPVYSTAVIFSDLQLDRSPCGTGSCALMVALTARAAIDPDEAIQTVGPSGERFELVARPNGKGADNIAVQLTGDAFITGIHQWIVDARDPMAAGFRLE